MPTSDDIAKGLLAVYSSEWTRQLLRDHLRSILTMWLGNLLRPIDPGKAGLSVYERGIRDCADRITMLFMPSDSGAAEERNGPEKLPAITSLKLNIDEITVLFDRPMTAADMPRLYECLRKVYPGEPTQKEV